MASQVLSGSGNVSYTNNTGQNVRVVINYMRVIPALGTIVISWANTSVNESIPVIGRAISNAVSSPPSGAALPTEIMLAPGQTFSATNISAYNIVVIPEAG